MKHTPLRTFRPFFQAMLLMFTLGLSTMIATTEHALAQVPRNISYQGELYDGGVPANAPHTFKISYYDASGTKLFSETFTNTDVRNGLFTLALGSSQSGGFPSTMTFNEQYFMGISVDAGNEFSPRTALVSSPYALNAGSVNGLEASKIPLAGVLYPLDATGHIDPRVLPATSNSINSINNVQGDALGNLNIVPGFDIQLATDFANHQLKIRSTAVGSVLAGHGLTGGGRGDTVTLTLAPGGVTGPDVANGAISGRKLDPFTSGLGLYQDTLGNLNIGVDNSTIDILSDIIRVKPLGIGTPQLADGAVTNPKIGNGAVNAIKVDPTQIQLRVNRAAAPGSFIQGINQDGSVNTGTVQVDQTLTRNIFGNDLLIGIALNNANNWTALQSFFGGASASTLSVSGATLLSGLTNNGPITNFGSLTENGALGVTGLTILSGLTNNGNFTESGNVIVTGSSDLRGPLFNSTGPLTLQGNVLFTGTITAPAAGHTFGTFGTDANVVTINGALGGTGTELRVFGDQSLTGNLTIGGNTSAQALTATTINATTVNTTNLGGAGGLGTIILTSPLNAGVGGLQQVITGGLFNAYTLNNGSINVGAVITNSGTIAGGAISNATITGGTINNTLIGLLTPAPAGFTSLTASGNSNIGTGISTVNSVGAGNLTTNSIGAGNSTTNFFGAGANATNTFGNLNGTNSVLGLTNVGSTSGNGAKLIVNGIVSPGFPSATDFEFVVNGDAQATGTLVAPTGAFDQITTATQALNDISFTRGIRLNGALGQNNLQVNGTSLLGGLVTASSGITDNGVLNQNATANFLDANFNGPILNRGALTQQGTATFSGPIINNGTLSQVGLASFSAGIVNNGALTQVGTATFSAAGGIVNNGTLLQNGFATFGSAGILSGGVLTQNATSHFLDATFNGPINNAGVLTQQGSATFGGPIINNGPLTQNGLATFSAVNGIVNNGPLNQNGPMTVPVTSSIVNNGTLLQGGAAIFNGTVNMTGLVSIPGGITTSGSAVFGAGSFTSLTNSGSLTQTGIATFAVGGGITNNGPLVQHGVATFTASSGFAGITNTGSLTQTGPTTTSGFTNNGSFANVGSFSQSGGIGTFAGITNNGVLTQNGAATFVGITNSSTLTQSSTANFAAPATFTGITNGTVATNAQFTQNGPSTFSTLAQFSGILNGTIATPASLTQIGTSSFSALASFNGGISSTASVTNTGTLTQTGAATFSGITNSGTLSQTGTSNFTNTAAFAGVTNSGTLSQTGAASFTNSVAMSNPVTMGNTGILTPPPGSYELWVYGASTGALVQAAGLDVLRLQSTSANASGVRYASFYDGSGSRVGSIRGDLLNDVYSTTPTGNNYQQTINTMTPLTPTIADAPAKNVAIAEQQLFQYLITKNNVAGFAGGVAYVSGSADYAEYLKRSDANELLFPGEIVGVVNGVISKHTKGAQIILPISLAPVVLGNEPPVDSEKQYSKVAFLGQVPVRVRGIVEKGDFIIASGLDDGIGIAISPERITAEQFTSIVGRSWDASSDQDTKYVNVAVGLNAKSTSDFLSHQQAEIDALKHQSQTFSQTAAQLEKEVLELKQSNLEVATMKAKLDRLEKLLAQPEHATTKAVILHSN
jgi:hypothetical protein